MVRTLWKGSLSFGLVNVPVALHSGVRDRDIHFQLLHGPDCSPIETRRVCAHEDREVPWQEIAKGYELEDGRWVLLTDEDLEAAAPRKSHTIDIEEFVALAEIDPVYFDRPYLLAPSDEGAARAYTLLSEIMRDSGLAAVGRFVMRARERLVAIREREGALTLTTMRFHDEVRATSEISAEFDAAKPERKQVDAAMAVIEELSVPFDPKDYRDEHRAQLARIIKRKQQGKKITAVAPVAEPEMTVPDLMGALEQSLAQLKAAGAKQKRAAASKPAPQTKPPRSSAKALKPSSGAKRS